MQIKSVSTTTERKEVLETKLKDLDMDSNSLLQNWTWIPTPSYKTGHGFRLPLTKHRFQLSLTKLDIDSNSLLQNWTWIPTLSYKTGHRF